MKANVAQIEEALRKSGGFITQAGKLLGMSHQAVSFRISKSERLQVVRREIEEEYKDLCEISLLKAVKNGEAWAVCFYLKCKGKDRGYVERLEHTGAEGNPIDIRYVNDWRINGNHKEETEEE